MNWLTFDNSYYTTKRGKTIQNVHAVKDTLVDTIQSSLANNKPFQTPVREQQQSENSLGASFTVPTNNTTTTAGIALSTNGILSSPNQNQLLWLQTDRVLAETPEFSYYFNCFKENQESWFEEYAKAHVKMSLLGSKLNPKGGFKLTD